MSIGETEEKLEKYCDTTLEMSPYPNAKPLHRDLLCTEIVESSYC